MTNFPPLFTTESESDSSEEADGEIVIVILFFPSTLKL